MTKIFLVDDEPLVLIGMQGMLNWAELGYTVVGTARNGAEALKAIGETYPDIVVSDIRMPVMDGFTLAESCHKDGSALPVFIMLTSYEEFDYVKRSMRLGVVDYLVKIDLTAESLTAALDKARAAVEKERRLQAPAAPAVSMDIYRDRLFLQLYGGLLTDRAAFDRQCAELGLDFHAPQYVVAVGSTRNTELSTEQLLTLSTGVTRMAAETLSKYRPCRVIGMDLQHFSALLPLQEGEDPETALTPALQATGQILYNYFSSQIYWAVGRAVPDILQISQSRQDALAAQQLHHQLLSVADAQHRHAQLIHALVAAGCILFQHARRAAGENHAHGVLRANRLQARVIGQDAGIHMAFAHAPRNQLRVLSAEIQNDDFLCFRH